MVAINYITSSISEALMRLYSLSNHAIYTDVLYYTVLACLNFKFQLAPSQLDFKSFDILY